MKIGYDLFYFDECYLYTALKYSSSHHIPMYNLHYNQGKYLFYTHVIYRKKLIKTNYFIYSSTCGLIKYFLFSFSKIMCVIGFVFSLIVSSQVIFDIKVIGNNSNVNNIILQNIDKIGVKAFSGLLSYKKQNDILLYLKKKMINYAEYLNVYQKGSVFFVEYTSKNVNKEIVNNYKPLYASKDGLIYKIDVQSGNVCVKINDYVKKGDKLVDNQIADTQNKVHIVDVKGNVYAYTTQYFKAKANCKNDFTESFLFLLLNIRSKIPLNAVIDKENVLQISKTNSKIEIRVQYTLIENIGVKGE